MNDESYIIFLIVSNFLILIKDLLKKRFVFEYNFLILFYFIFFILYIFVFFWKESKIISYMRLVIYIIFELLINTNSCFKIWVNRGKIKYIYLEG